MSTTTVILIISIYFMVMVTVSYFTSKGGGNASFFTADRSSSWYMVAFGMIGASLSGVTFISVPGRVGLGAESGTVNGFAYMQIVFGYLIGYLVIAYVLLPVYYRLRLVSIYTYLGERFGQVSYRTGAAFFLISRVLGASFRLLLVASVLEVFIFEDLGLPFWLDEFVTIALIWLYTFRGGIKTIIWTDVIQTSFMLIAVVITIYELSGMMGFTVLGWTSTVWESDYSKVFFWDWRSGMFFPKYFLSGAFITIAMTGLDQDMMQKNLTCKSIGEAQKNMLSLALALVPVNLLFLSLGALLYLFADANGIQEVGDKLYPAIAKDHLGLLGAVMFLIGVIAAAYSSADSALTSLTTSVCVDFLGHKGESKAEKNQRIWVHLGFSVLLFVVVVAFTKQTSVLGTLFKTAGYTYGPLLGLFAFGLFTKWSIKDMLAPVVCVAAIIMTVCFEWLVSSYTAYQFSFELLPFNGLMTFLGLWVIKQSNFPQAIR